MANYYQLCRIYRHFLLFPLSNLQYGKNIKRKTQYRHNLKACQTTSLFSLGHRGYPIKESIHHAGGHAVDDDGAGDGEHLGAHAQDTPSACVNSKVHSVGIKFSKLIPTGRAGGYKYPYRIYKPKKRLSKGLRCFYQRMNVFSGRIRSKGKSGTQNQSAVSSEQV